MEHGSLLHELASERRPFAPPAVRRGQRVAPIATRAARPATVRRVSSLSTLDPSLDVVFKLLLTTGAEGHEVLVALLTAVLRPKKPFAKVTVRNPEIPREGLDDRGVILDIFAELEDGTRLDIEMQSERRPSFRQRALYYWARMFGSELERGAEYARLRPAISVLFLGYREFGGARVHSVFRLLEVHDHERFTEAMELACHRAPQARAGDERRAPRRAAVAGMDQVFLSANGRRDEGGRDGRRRC